MPYLKYHFSLCCRLTSLFGLFQNFKVNSMLASPGKATQNTLAATHTHFILSKDLSWRIATCTDPGTLNSYCIFIPEVSAIKKLQT